MTPALAEGSPTVAACVAAIASAMSVLPVRVYQTTPRGKVELGPADHWLPALLASPGPRSTWPELVESLMASTLLHGNGVILIGYNADGQPDELTPIPWPYVTPLCTASGQLAFNVNMPFPPFLGAGIFRRYLDSETIYLKDRSDNGGWTGRARLGRSPQAIEAALLLQDFSAAIWRNAASPSGIITHPGKLNAAAKTYLREEYTSKYAGPQNARKTVILDEGMSWLQTQVSPEDAETLESRRFTVVELCRLFGVPPAIVQSLENNAFSSAEMAGKWFAQNTLTPWCRKLEAAISRSLLGDDPSLQIEIDMAGLLRGDYAARWASYATAIQNNILSVAEIRDAEGYSPEPAP